VGRPGFTGRRLLTTSIRLKNEGDTHGTESSEGQTVARTVDDISILLVNGSMALAKGGYGKDGESNSDKGGHHTGELETFITIKRNSKNTGKNGQEGENNAQGDGRHDVPTSLVASIANTTITAISQVSNTFRVRRNGGYSSQTKIQSMSGVSSIEKVISTAALSRDVGK